MVNFSLTEGFTTDDFLQSNNKMEAFIKEQEGVLYRSLCEKEDGSYIDIVYWENMECAKKAQAAFYESEVCQAFAKCIETNSVKLEHVKVIASQCCES